MPPGMISFGAKRLLVPPQLEPFLEHLKTDFQNQFFLDRFHERESRRRPYWDFRHIRRRRPPSRKFRANPGLDVTTGQFAANTGSATTTVTTGFQGKAVIFWATSGTANTDVTAGNAGWSIGFSDGTNHRCIAWAGDNAVATTNVIKSLRTASALDVYSDGDASDSRRITGVTFNATDITLTWSAAPIGAYLVGYILLGGSDITNVLVGHDLMPTATGTWNVDNNGSSVGFTGDFVMMLYTKQTADGLQTRANCSLGFAASATKEFTMAWGVDNTQTMSTTVDAVSYTNQNASIAYITDGAETVDMLANFLGFTSTGFDLNISNAQATANTIMPFLLIKGGQWDVGTTTLPTGGASRTITGMAFQPQGLFLGITKALTNATVTAGAQGPLSGVGAAVSTSTETYAGLGHNDAINTIVQREIQNDKIAGMEFGSVPPASEDFTAFTSDGWTITSEANNGSALQTGWFAMGNNAVVTQRYATRVMRAARREAEHGLRRTTRWKTTFPPPVQERVQSRQLRMTRAARRREQAESSKWQVWTPPPTVSIFRALFRKVFAGRVRTPAPSHVLKQTFPPPVAENVLRRMFRRAIAGRKREPGRGLVLKQTFPPPVRENVWLRMMRVARAGRKRAGAVSRRWQVRAPAFANIWRPVIRLARAARKRAIAASRLWRIGAPAAAPAGGGLITWRIIRAGRRLRDGRRAVSRWMNLPPMPPGPAPLLKRVAGWFRLFMRI